MSYAQGYDNVLSKLASLADEGYTCIDLVELSIDTLESDGIPKIAMHGDSLAAGEQDALCYFVKEASALFHRGGDLDNHLISFDLINKIAANMKKKKVDEAEAARLRAMGVKVKRRVKQAPAAAPTPKPVAPSMYDNTNHSTTDFQAPREAPPKPTATPASSGGGGGALAGLGIAGLAAGGAYAAYRLKKRYDQRRAKAAQYISNDVDTAVEILRHNGYDV